MTRKAKKVLNRLLEKQNCPHCHKSLLKEGIGWAEEGTQYFEVNLVGRGKDSYLDYDEEEFERTGTGWFYCKGCGTELNFDEDGIKEVLELEKET